MIALKKNISCSVQNVIEDKQEMVYEKQDVIKCYLWFWHLQVTSLRNIKLVYQIHF